MNIVIGSSSQQANYYPENYIKISSRDIDINFLQNNNFESVYFCFAEQRIYDESIDFISTNYTYTLQLIKNIIHNSKKIVIFGTCELWSNLSGLIRLNTNFNFNINNRYTLSKFILIDEIKRLRSIDKNYNKICIIYPFYFNSVYRTQYFLFGKIFDSIINKNKIEVGNLDFYRDIIHTNFFVKKTIEAESDLLIGSGKLFNIRQFVKDLYISQDLDYNELVKENLNIPSNNKLIKSEVDWEYNYEDLLNETINDINIYKTKLNNVF